MAATAFSQVITSMTAPDQKIVYILFFLFKVNGFTLFKYIQFANHE